MSGAIPHQRYVESDNDGGITAANGAFPLVSAALLSSHTHTVMLQAKLHAYKRIYIYTAKTVWWISLKTAYYITQNQDLE